LGGRIGTASRAERRPPHHHVRPRNPAPHPRPTPAQPPVNPRAVGAGAFRLTLLRNSALRPYIWPLLFSNN
jgi:hypothetical protein